MHLTTIIRIAMTPIIRTCKLCGKNTVLTFEHVPPRSAFNRWPSRFYAGKELMLHVASPELPWELSKRKWVQQQRGYGAYTLCADCNSYTGRKYAPAYTDFCVQALQQIGEQGSTRGNITISFRNIYPLKVMKEILCMFLSINHAKFGDRYPDIREFVKNYALRREIRCASVFSYANIGRLHRIVGNAGIMNVSDGWGRLVSELGAIPFGFVMEMTPAKERELTPLADFSDLYDIDEKASVDVKFPIKQSNSFIPLDYRTREEILAGAKA